MDERYFKDKISAYLDNELAPQERTIVDEYIRNHPEAQEQLAKLESLKRLSNAHLSLGGDDLYWERNARKIESAIGMTSSREAVIPHKSAWQSHWGKLTAVAASVAILFFIAINRDEVEKRVLPSVSPSVEVAEETQLDTAGADVATAVPPVERPSSTEREVLPQKRVEKSKEVASTKDAIEDSKINKFGLSDSTAQKVAIPAIQSQESVQTATPSMSAPKADMAMDRLAPTSAELSSPEAENDTVARVLAHWTSIHDSLAPIIAGLDKKSESQSLVMKALKAPLTTSLRETNADDLKPAVLSWLEANYHIAEMTSDMVQKVGAVQALKAFENHSDSVISSKASEYLSKLAE